MKRSFEKGLSIVEFLIAVAIFSILAAATGSLVVHSFSANRLGNEETKASLLASEGIEAAISIRNQNFANLANGTYGISKASGYWEFSGSYDDTGKFRRVITVEDGRRLGNGTLVESEGSPDSDTKKITSTIAWNFTPVRENQVSYQIYLTNWDQPVSSTSCSSYCVSLGGYSGGICRQNATQCTKNGETYRSGGNLYCTGGASADTCCCRN